MKAIKVEGVLKNYNGEWSLETIDNSFSSDILVGIDEILDFNFDKTLDEGDKIEIIIKIKRSNQQ